MSEVIERFIQYVKIDTQSCEDSETHPSTLKQHDLAKVLFEQLQEMGAEEVIYDREYCYIYAKLSANGLTDVPKIGFIAHMDTATEVTDTNVKPRIVQNYQGDDIVLNAEQNIILSPVDFPELRGYTGKDLIVTDGTTLLGADDKAGVAEIMTMLSYLIAHPECKHGEIRVCFTPDEEVGRGTDFFDLKRFDADAAYTVDGGALSELEYENFNAASAVVTFHGRSVHPGDAKGKMVNALLLAHEYVSGMPANETPATTEGYEGFYHLMDMKGGCEQAEASFIIRDHSRESFEARKEFMKKLAVQMNEKYGREAAVCVCEDSYYNMKEKIEPHMELIEHAKEALLKNGVTPKVVPVRGGTDGARLSYMGLPTPNLCTGGMNYHGRFEYACVQDMETMVQVLVTLACTK